MHGPFVDTDGDGSTAWTAAASKNPSDLDSAIDHELLRPVWPALYHRPACSSSGCLANSADPFHHDNLGCSYQRQCEPGNAPCQHFKDSKIKFTQRFQNVHLGNPVKTAIL